MADLTLRHVTWKGSRIFIFYTGQIKVREGVLTIPHHHPEWVRVAWVNGYRVDPATGKAMSLAEAQKRNRNEAVVEEPVEATPEPQPEREPELVVEADEPDAEPEAAEEEEPVVEQPKKRGRPRKSAESTESAKSEEVDDAGDSNS